ncbi:MAG: N-acetylmuramoyl-L-alanine amidase [Armatimonadetes bacterium]|nr:N-acetylmuramoyl-L-alanine amidase [Armatimonadota bacterium]
MGKAVRSAFRCALVIGFLAVWMAPRPAAAATPRVVIGDRTAPCEPPPVLIDGEVHVPLAFRYGSLPIKVDSDGEVVIVRGPGDLEARVPLVLHEGHAYYAIARASAGVQLNARWVERLQKVFIAPRISSVRPDAGDRVLTLRVTTAYPVTYRVEKLADPPRLLVEVSGAQLYTDATTVPVARAGVRQVRAAQYSFDPSVVRIVLDLEGAARYRALSAETTTQIRLRIGVPADPSDADLDRLLEAPDAEAVLADVAGVGVEYDDQGNTRVVVRATAPVRGSVVRLQSPPRLAVDIPNTMLRAEPPLITPGTPFVAGVRLGQFQDTVTRVVVDLSNEVEYALSEGADPGTLILNLRAVLGLVPRRGLPGLTVMLDPGHGGSQPGTTGVSGRKEKELNLDVAKRVYALLESAGARPEMTRGSDDTVGLYARPGMANAKGVHVFISIHANSTGQRVGRARGIETYYCHAHSLPLARAVHRQLVSELKAPDRKVIRRPGLVVTRESKMPSILVEIGYMNHPEEDRLLGTPEYRQRVARAIFNGIAVYCGESVGQEDLESREEESVPNEALAGAGASGEEGQ